MQNLRIILLGGAALTALACNPAIAQNNATGFHFVAIHGGRLVNKTKLHNQTPTHKTYTLTVHTYAPFSNFYHHRQPLLGTFYRYENSNDPCSFPSEKVKVSPRKTVYGTVRAMTMSYTGGCPEWPVKGYGAGYEITDPNAKGKADFVEVVHEGRYLYFDRRYKATLNLEVDISIEKSKAGSETTR